MTVILSWNIQNAKGTDGVISLERIAETIKALCDPDVICLQEISSHLALVEGGVDGEGAPDQIAEIAALFPGYSAIFGAAMDTGEAGWQFGNATLTRLPLLSVFRHALPQPAEGGVRHMARQATEITVVTPQGPLRVINTHLEFHSANQRRAQIERLRYLHREIVSGTRTPPQFRTTGPYRDLSRHEDCVLCGDFNMETDFDEYGAMLAPLGADVAPFQDAWRVVYPDRPHDPTCGIHDHVQWPKGAHCRDFFFITQAVARNLRDLQVDTVTSASDHQPLALHIAGT